MYRFKSYPYILPLLLVSLLAFSGCASEEEQPTSLALIGTYDDDWGSTHEITADSWTISWSTGGSAVYHVISYDNAAGQVLTQNDVNNDYFPEMYSRFDWAEVDTKLYYCQTVYAADTVAAAEGVPAADSADLATGCGGFPWTGLIAK